MDLSMEIEFVDIIILIILINLQLDLNEFMPIAIYHLYLKLILMIGFIYFL